tara:strand:+ start:141 stop:1460 length:1320 start_codon:yes stop_codon:yes gene_type:complete
MLVFACGTESSLDTQQDDGIAIVNVDSGAVDVADASESSDAAVSDGGVSEDSVTSDAADSTGADVGNCQCDDDNPCTTDTCAAGQCQHQPVAESLSCDDGDACTTEDQCSASKCVGSTPLDCSSANPCVIASCDPSKGCSFVAKTGSCDDDSMCTENDVCSDGFCKGTAPNCDDGNLCTDDSCDPVKGCVSSQAVDQTPCGQTKTCEAGVCVSVGTLFAHTSSALYKLDLKTKSFSLVGTFTFNKSKGLVTDIALDRSNIMYAVTFTDLFKCKTQTASCSWVMKLPTQFNGLTFVHKGTVYPSQDALIGIANNGGWWHIDLINNKVIKLGSYGSGYSSSGDAFSVLGVGTYATVKKSGVSEDVLVKVNPKTGKVISDLGVIGANNLWGLAWWGGVFYGFSSNTNVWEIDEKSGKGKSLQGFSGSKAPWWGAGVSTEAQL